MPSFEMQSPQNRRKAEDKDGTPKEISYTPLTAKNSRLKSMIHSDTNRELENYEKKEHNKEAKTWIEVNGKMIEVTASQLKEMMRGKRAA